MRTLEDALATLASVRLDLAVVAFRLSQHVLTDSLWADLQAVARAAADLEEARGYLQRLHPNRLP